MSRPKRRWWILGAVVACSASLKAQSESPVTIEGGPDASGRNYTWQVQNESPLAIVSITFPHFRAVGLTGPPGGDWDIACTELVAPGRKMAPGECTVKSKDARPVVAPGRTAEFNMGTAAQLAARGRGDVTVIFADGTSTVVRNVVLPQREKTLDRLIPAIGMGGVFLVFLVVAHRRRRKRSVATTEPGADG